MNTTQHASTTTNISSHMKGFLVALESRQELGFYTTATTPLTESLMSYLDEDSFIQAAELLDENDDLMGAVNVVEPFYVEYFTKNCEAIKTFLAINTDIDLEDDIQSGYQYIYNLIEDNCMSDFGLEHVKAAFNNPRNTTIDTLDDSNPYDDVYYFVSEFTSALVLRSICQAYTNYTQLELA